MIPAVSFELEDDPVAVEPFAQRSRHAGRDGRLDSPSAAEQPARVVLAQRGGDGRLARDEVCFGRDREGAERLRPCLAFNPTEWYAFSDHSPIVASFED